MRIWWSEAAEEASEAAGAGAGEGAGAGAGAELAVAEAEGVGAGGATLGAGAPVEVVEGAAESGEAPVAAEDEHDADADEDAEAGEGVEMELGSGWRGLAGAVCFCLCCCCCSVFCTWHSASSSLYCRRDQFRSSRTYSTSKSIICSIGKMSIIKEFESFRDVQESNVAMFKLIPILRILIKIDISMFCKAMLLNYPVQ